MSTKTGDLKAAWAKEIRLQDERATSGNLQVYLFLVLALRMLAALLIKNGIGPGDLPEELE